MSAKTATIMCARCVKPIQGTPVKDGRYTYGPCCKPEAK